MTTDVKAAPIPTTDGVSPWLTTLHLATLFHFAVAQPIFDRLNERLSYCRDLNLPSWVVYAFVVLLSVGCPSVVALVVWITRRWSASAAQRLSQILQGILWCLLALPLLKMPEFLPALVIYGGAIILSGIAVWGYARSRAFRSILTLCSIGVVLFPSMFLARYTASADGKYAIAQRLPNATSPPVVMIVFDEFCGLSLMTPEREIDAARFPNFAQLARDGHWFRNAASVHEVTTQAVPAILSGRHPNARWMMTTHDRPQNLFSMLIGSGGYDYAAFEPVTRLAPEGLSHQVMTRGLWSERIPDFVSTLFRVYLHHLVPVTHEHCLPQVSKLWFGVRLEGEVDPHAQRGTFRYRWSMNRAEQWEHFLRTLDGAEAPTLHFMHILLPHVPWSYLPSGRRVANDSAEWELEQLGQDSDGWTTDELHSAHSQQRYLLQLMYTDKLIGQMIDKLRETGMYDRAMIVVTADHGISFRPGEYRRATNPGNRDEIQAVPLIIKRPGEIAGKVHDRPVESVDILPTLAEILGYQLTLQVDGRSIFHEDVPFRSRRRYGVDAPLTDAPVEEIAQSPAPLELFQRFGRGSDPEALYRLGPIPELVGQKVELLPQTSAPPLTIAMSRFADVWTADQTQAVPGFYEGQVLGHNPVDEPPVVLAITVNGVIRCVTRTYQYAAALSQWSAMVPESAYHEGSNDVRCYQVLGQAPDWTLTPCELRLPADQDS